MPERFDAPRSVQKQSADPRGPVTLASASITPVAPGAAPPGAAMCTCFREQFAAACCFREDAALADALANEAGPVLEALHVALAPRDPPRALHESYALTTLLARRAALLGATPSAALVLSAALVSALREAGGCRVDEAAARGLTIVVLEGYCAARDERVTGDLLLAAARAQVALPLAPGCLAIFLAGCHDERALVATLDGFGRRLLHDEIVSCLLDVSRLSEIDGADDALARAVANFAASALTLGAALIVLGASPSLRARLARWLPGAPLQYVDSYPAGQAEALARAGFTLKSRLRWLRAGWPRGARDVQR